MRPVLRGHTHGESNFVCLESVSSPFPSPFVSTAFVIYTANTTEFPVGNRGPRVAKFQLDFILASSLGTFFLAPTR